ncbi:MAG TPA: L,D-transpeptidase [Bauldia sp.]|nr:L,D-transpeptidase [Bauldia sp.]
MFRRLRILALAAALLPLAAFAAHASGKIVPFATPGYAAGTIIVNTPERRLYLVLGNGQALRFPVGVGKQGKQWSGAARIVAKFIKPAWEPPAEVKHDNPWLPDYIAGGVPSNPMGAAAMVLTGGEYAIHGTNRPNSIGGFVSYGCIRMYNADILALYQRVDVGTPVVVLQ